MLKNFRRLALALGAAAVLSFGTGQANAAILLSVSNGALPPLYFFTNLQNLDTGGFTIPGVFTADIETSTTNYPGTTPVATVGTLATTVRFQSVSDSTASLTFSASVYGTDTTLGGLGANVGTIQIAGPPGTSAPDSFVNPYGSNITLQSSVSAASNLSITQGSAQNITKFNNGSVTNLASGFVSLAAGGNSSNTLGVAGSTPPSLLSQVGTVTGVNTNASSVVVNFNSSFTASPVPEPATFGMAAFAGLTFLAVGVRRKMNVKTA